MCDSGRSWLSLYTVNPCKSCERLDSPSYLPSTLMTCWVTVVSFLAFSACLFGLFQSLAWKQRKTCRTVPSGSQWFPVSSIPWQTRTWFYTALRLNLCSAAAEFPRASRGAANIVIQRGSGLHGPQVALDQHDRVARMARSFDG